MEILRIHFNLRQKWCFLFSVFKKIFTFKISIFLYHFLLSVNKYWWHSSTWCFFLDLLQARLVFGFYIWRINKDMIHIHNRLSILMNWWRLHIGRLTAWVIIIFRSSMKLQQWTFALNRISSFLIIIFTNESHIWKLLCLSHHSSFS